jgi:hypothetical protein
MACNKAFFFLLLEDCFFEEEDVARDSLVGITLLGVLPISSGIRGLNHLLNSLSNRIKGKLIPPFDIPMSFQVVTDNDILPFKDPREPVLLDKMEDMGKFRTIGINLETC